MPHKIHIIVRGRASGRDLLVRDVNFPSDSKDPSLLEWLSESKIPVASSCNGDGVCQKCKVRITGNEVLSCQVNMAKLIEIERKCNNNQVIITIDYL